MPHRVIAVTVLLVSFGVVIAPGKIESIGLDRSRCQQAWRKGKNRGIQRTKCSKGIAETFL